MSIVHTFLITAVLVLLTRDVSSSTRSYVPSQVSRNVSRNEYRLPRDVKPISYHITLNPNMEDKNFTFTGKSVINITFVNATSNITLHARDLIINSIDLKCNPTYNGTSTKNITDIKTDIIKFVFNKTVQNGSICNLTLNYTGKDGDKKGFYRTSYTNEDGKKKWMASTQFEPIAARQAFPCWDEPSFKAKFSISIKHSQKYVALSNMHLKGSNVDPNDWKIITEHFAESPLMSSYLVAFAVGEFLTVDGDNLDFQVWSRRNVNNNGKYALEVGPKILEALGNYTNYQYEKHGLPKMYSLAVPELGYGAMENWGLVIYKEDGFLYAQNSSSTSKKEGVITIMAHEFAHQWFGNLVTAEWWDDIWLNEGFANYFQYVTTHEIEPEWRMMDRFVLINLQATAFVVDSRNDSHAMKIPRENNEAIGNAFDDISYSKSGSVLRMISYVMGDENFKNALRQYINKLAFKSATSSHLFSELETANKNKITNLADILNNWISTPGYPVITVTRDYKNGTATINQTRFLDTVNASSTEKYWIPINFATEDELNFNDTKVTDWFKGKSDSLIISNLPKNDNKFVIFNKQQFGYYRVNYDRKNWELITQYLALNHTKIHVLNRAQLIDDALNLAKVHKLEYTVALSLIGYLNKETDFVPWSAAWRGIKSIAESLANTDFAEPFKKYVLKLSEHLVADVQAGEFNKTDHVSVFRRVEALNAACTLGSNSCRSEATEKLIKWINNPKENAFSPNDETWIICAGIRNANETTWDKLWEKYLNEKNMKILNALGCTSNTKILNEFINKVTNKNKTENLSAVFRAIYTGSDEGVDVILDFLTTNSTKIISRNYTKEQLKLDFTALGQRLTNEKQQEKLKQFIKNADKELKSTAEEALKSVEKNLNIIKIHLVQFQLFFKNDESEPTGDSATMFTLSTTLILASIFVSQIYY